MERVIAKSKGLCRYSKLRQRRRDLLEQGKRPQVIFVEEPQEELGPLIDIPLPLYEFPLGQPASSLEQSAGSLLDASIPLDEIPQNSTILRPTKARAIEKVVEWGKKKIENWGEWLKEIDSVKNTRPVVDDALKTFKAHIAELYKSSKQLEHQRDSLTPLSITKIHSKACKKFNSFIDTYKISGDVFNIDNVLLTIGNMVRDDRKLVNGDKIQWILSHYSWKKPISTKLITITDQLAVEMVNQLARFVEYKNVPLSEVNIEIRSVKIPRGKGRLRITKLNAPCKRSIITIKNDDSICLARSIVTAVANINKHKWTKSELKNGFNKSRTLQKDEAIKLHEEAGVEINEFGSTLEDINRFAKHLNVQINVIDGDQFNELIFTSENEDTSHNMIYLFKNNNHFDVITSMPAFLAKDYYCHTCKTSYTHRDCHKCPSKCIACFKYFPDGKGCSSKESIN